MVTTYSEFCVMFIILCAVVFTVTYFLTIK